MFLVCFSRFVSHQQWKWLRLLLKCGRQWTGITRRFWCCLLWGNMQPWWSRSGLNSLKLKSKTSTSYKTHIWGLFSFFFLKNTYNLCLLFKCIFVSCEGDDQNVHHCAEDEEDAIDSCVDWWPHSEEHTQCKSKKKKRKGKSFCHEQVRRKSREFACCMNIEQGIQR